MTVVQQPPVHGRRATASTKRVERAVLPSVSVVVPSHGRPAPLATCVDAIARLDYPKELLEIIIVDDNSLEPIAARLPRPDDLSLRVIRQERTGPGGARNAGVAVAEGGVIAFLDDDCAPASDWLRRLVAPLSSQTRVIAGGKTVNALTGNPYSVASQTLVSYLYGHYATGRPTLRFFTTNNLALRRDLFREVGGFDPQFRQAAAEDREFCVRCARHGIELEHVHDAVVYHAHALTWRTFWMQHFTYGREAYRFHALQERAEGRRFEVEPLSFYTRMLAYPFREGQRRALAVTGLLGMSQLANTSGFLREAVRSRAQSRAARRATTRA